MNSGTLEAQFSTNRDQNLVRDFAGEEFIYHEVKIMKHNSQQTVTNFWYVILRVKNPFITR